MVVAATGLTSNLPLGFEGWRGSLLSGTPLMSLGGCLSGRTTAGIVGAGGAVEEDVDAVFRHDQYIVDVR